MKSIKFVLLALAASVTSSMYAQTVDEVISKHVDAIGGKEKLSQVKSLYSESTVDVMGNSAPQKEYLIEGKGFKSELDFSGTSIIQCVTDKGGWMVNPMAGGSDAQAIPDAAYKAGKPQIYLGGALVGYAAKGYKAELMGKDGGRRNSTMTSTKLCPSLLPMEKMQLRGFAGMLLNIKLKQIGLGSWGFRQEAPSPLQHCLVIQKKTGRILQHRSIHFFLPQ